MPELVLAHNSLVVALPFFGPLLPLAGALVVAMLRDRRRTRRELA